MSRYGRKSERRQTAEYQKYLENNSNRFSDDRGGSETFTPQTVKEISAGGCRFRAVESGGSTKPQIFFGRIVVTGQHAKEFIGKWEHLTKDEIFWRYGKFQKLSDFLEKHCPDFWTESDREKMRFIVENKIENPELCVYPQTAPEAENKNNLSKNEKQKEK